MGETGGWDEKRRAPLAIAASPTVAAKARRMNAAGFHRDPARLSPRLRHQVCTLDALAAEVARARRGV
jgi:hypothetical protein